MCSYLMQCEEVEIDLKLITLFFHTIFKTTVRCAEGKIIILTLIHPHSLTKFSQNNELGQANPLMCENMIDVYTS